MVLYNLWNHKCFSANQNDSSLLSVQPRTQTICTNSGNGAVCSSVTIMGWSWASIDLWEVTDCTRSKPEHWEVTDVSSGSGCWPFSTSFTVPVRYYLSLTFSLVRSSLFAQVKSCPHVLPSVLFISSQLEMNALLLIFKFLFPILTRSQPVRPIDLLFVVGLCCIKLNISGLFSKQTKKCYDVTESQGMITLI